MTSSLTTPLKEMTINNEQLRRENDVLKADITQLRTDNDGMKDKIKQLKTNNDVMIRRTTMTSRGMRLVS